LQAAGRVLRRSMEGKKFTKNLWDRR
jgi:hypothetical protein